MQNTIGTSTYTQTYIGCKLIKALPMNNQQWEEEKTGQPYVLEDMPKEGYRITYADGYTSWTPKEVFDRTYRKVTAEEVMFVSS